MKNKPDNIFDVDIDNFDQKVIAQSHNKLVILDISAKWCGPCLVLEPLLDKLAAENDDINLAKLEAEDENMKIAGRYGVRGFPTVLAIKNGEEVDRFHGVKPYSYIQDFVNRSQ